MNEGQLLASALSMLNEVLPDPWSAERIEGSRAGQGPGDALFSIGPPNGGTGAVLVDARPTFSAGDVEKMFGGLTRRLWSKDSEPVLLVSEYLSPRARELLIQEGVGYLDLTGNMRLAMSYPTLFIERQGRDRPGTGPRTNRASVAGAMAGQVVRFLAEVPPPYGVTDIESETGVSKGHVSRILSGLRSEGLIDQEPRGPVEHVNWAELLRRRAATVDLLSGGGARKYLARSGARSVIDALADHPTVASRLVITGSFAAADIRPIAAPALLVAYLEPQGGPPYFREVEEELGLLEADEGFDVVLLWPDAAWIVDASRSDEAGRRWADLTQVAIDCLSGTGRMPQEGEALLEWMAEDEGRWKRPPLGASQGSL